MRSTAQGPDRELLWSAVLAERPRAERVARSRCASRQDAEDCVQEAMARVVAMSAVDTARVGPLLATVTANLAADSHRGRARAAKAEPRLRAALVLEETPEDAVCDAAEARWLWQRIEVLAAQDRRVLELRAQGRSVADTAEALGLTYKATESSFTRARSKMRAVWRATAAVLGILWGRQTRRPATTAAFATVAVTLAFALLPQVQGEAAGPPTGSASPPLQTAAAAAGSATGRAEPAPAQAPRRAPAAAPTTAPAPAAPSAAPTAQSLVDAEPITIRGTTTGPTTVSRERQEETLAETVERCLAEGVHVTPYHVECRG